MSSSKSLTDHERAVYQWQMWIPDFGEAGQEKLKNASVLVSRVGGVGSVVAYELEAHITTVIPGQSPCLQCIWPENPPTWKRQFPVFGAVSGTVACMGAMEAIKLIAGIGEPLSGRLVRIDLRDMEFQTMRVSRREDCVVCGVKQPSDSLTKETNL